MTKMKTSYCQGCVRTEVPMKLTLANGRPYWLCDRCREPLPKEAYDKKKRKAWGATKNTNRGTNKS